jgi:hypothetical protein
MYGALYALSPEPFPTKDRGTGNAIMATANRIFGIMVSPSVDDCTRARLSTLTHHPGPDHCSACEPHDICANLDFRSYLHCLWFYCSLAAIRAPWARIFVASRSVLHALSKLCLWVA